MVMMKEGITTPLQVVKSVRPDEWRGLTSIDPGVLTPIAYVPLLREDRIRANCTVQVKSDETLHVVVNPVRVRVEAFLVPKTALARFGGSLEVLNRSYEGQAAPAGMGTTPAWLVAHPALPAGDKGHGLFDALGIHWQDGFIPNSDLVESYNCIVNWMRQNVSPGLPLVSLTNTTCLPAFWDSWRFADIKPSFDAAQMEGAIPVGLEGIAPVLGIAPFGAATLAATNANITRSALNVKVQNNGGTDGLVVNTGTGTQGVHVNLATIDGASVTLGNIELAKKTQAFAALRDRYRSVPEEYLIDLLMAGINVPDNELRQPVRLAYAEAILGQTERYATDGASLDTSVSNGMATVSFSLNTPSINTGGIVMVLMSIVPEQLYERIDDLALHLGDGTPAAQKTPRYVEDYLDPQKVEVVPNYFADTRHSDPLGVFGYAPLNYQWRRSFARVGGKFKRPVPDAFKEDRQRIWAVEKADPDLSADFYLCPTPFPKTVFADAAVQPYEVITVLQAQIVGNTVFGPGFEEDMGNYDRILATVDADRIDQTLTTVPAGMMAPGGLEEAVIVEGTGE